MPVIIVEGPPKDEKKREKLVKALTEALKEVYGYPENTAEIDVLYSEGSLEISGTSEDFSLEEEKKAKFLSNSV